MKLYAKDFGVLPGNTDVKAIEAMFEKLAESDEKRELIFSPGEYIVDSLSLKSRMLYITNTVGDKEFSADETPHKNRVQLYLNGVKNLTVNGNGAKFIADGKATNMALEDCENVELVNLSFSAIKPDLHEIKVVSASAFSVVFEIDDQSDYTVENDKLYFVGRDYKVSADYRAKTAYWISLIRKNTPNIIKRVPHPLIGALKIKSLGNRKIRVFYANAFRFKTGDRFYIFDNRRQYAGIFLNRCKNTKIENVSQRFNYSLALVAQDCENLTCEKLDFSPDENSNFRMASIADFIQVCMCRGRVEVRNSNFCGAGDDCINTHGVHFKTKRTGENEYIARFMHPQTHGYNPLHVGDTVAFISPTNLLECGRAEILESELVSEREIRLKLDKDVTLSGCDIIEDISACPELVFENNTVDMIITRGVLYTSRGKCIIRNNHFKSNSMSGILLSDDARSWYESGMCLDVTIENNIFDYCGQTPILIKPENWVHGGPIHKNITIKGNVFKKYEDYCIKAKSSDNISIISNEFSSRKHLKCKDCTNVKES